MPTIGGPGSQNPGVFNRGADRAVGPVLGRAPTDKLGQPKANSIEARAASAMRGALSPFADIFDTVFYTSAGIFKRDAQLIDKGAEASGGLLANVYMYAINTLNTKSYFKNNSREHEVFGVFTTAQRCEGVKGKLLGPVRVLVELGKSIRKYGEDTAQKKTSLGKNPLTRHVFARVFVATGTVVRATGSALAVSTGVCAAVLGILTLGESKTLNEYAVGGLKETRVIVDLTTGLVDTLLLPPDPPSTSGKNGGTSSRSAGDFNELAIEEEEIGLTGADLSDAEITLEEDILFGSLNSGSNLLLLNDSDDFVDSDYTDSCSSLSSSLCSFPAMLPPPLPPYSMTNSRFDDDAYDDTYGDVDDIDNYELEVPAPDEYYEYYPGAMTESGTLYLLRPGPEGSYDYSDYDSSGYESESYEDYESYEGSERIRQKEPYSRWSSEGLADYTPAPSKSFSPFRMACGLASRLEDRVQRFRGGNQHFEPFP